ncbi:bifunctional phosphopantothenoylcysteine decarboxylase/phosphopantothenate--cysteine ligase CoaBC [Edaphobacter sp.]|uniref:bifunctional phosphopantothenoylcysteine decarboxylase/phosphopantothenate--cysteine ligase CoaBC n=1 Tax=Edaphobacter sp. TaxID=1934404 RepID=UPI002DB9CCA7|nr:bifunctional phosphopantothenoylcysteine decarboxylase/phosphopantothenate--cysteine ligase CoaBC [Edaphobacter sp.]HEU5340187.1 bifunctional phosphopantothenoylcysteine decarboxylase/phosphopantothenate--cysteine ligase CoaBC [Edaphobacter sp.]
MGTERVKVTVGVAGGIAAYKSVELVRLLQNAGLDPHVIMTRAAEEFIRPLTFAGISGHNVITSLWNERAGAGAEAEEGAVSPMEHINEAQTTRLLVVAPATADILGKFAHGLADDFLTTMFLATSAPVIVAPSMNVNMWQHPAVQANLATLRARGVRVVEPGSGYLACGMVGGGRLAEPAEIAAAVAEVLAQAADASGKDDLAGETMLVTAGGTREAIDPVRFIGNRSSGRMGYAIAEAARKRGAHVILISAPTVLPAPAGCEVIPVVTAGEMRQAVIERLPEASIVVMAAAVSDYRVKDVAEQKLKRTGTRTLELEPTEDILAEVSSRRSPGTLVIGFAAETEHIVANALAKLDRKGIDAIVANDVSSAETGFDSERNAGSFLTRNGAVELPTMSKTEMASRILDQIAHMRTAIRSR